MQRFMTSRDKFYRWITPISANTANNRLDMIFLILCNFEMKEEINCLVNFTTAKYGILYIIIRRKIAIRGVALVLNEIFNYYYFRLG